MTDASEHSDHPEVMVDIPQNRLDDEATSQIIQRVVAPGTIGVDVGAHRGDVTAQIVHAAPDGAHIAIEPIPYLAQVVRERFPLVTVHEAALAAEAGPDVEFHLVVDNPSYSGLRERRYDRPNETVELIRVRTTTLDELVPTDAVVSLLKVDVEGGELGVFLGGSRVLDTRPVIVFEHGLGAADHYGTEPGTIHDLLTSHGLRASSLTGFLDFEPSYSRAQFEDEFYSGRRWMFVAHP